MVGLFIEVELLGDDVYALSLLLLRWISSR